ncbi:unnamed protein product (macronuclear) [Paramecium tetraurelia]|uniref:Protein kinase domain-containing protein n=1 Tax=Paramecium tetraurelia TaxID=5888 RepID=A0EAX5_PARTE|nr:uncharacterized protein GSPATT00025176001 [Paramecium tetraurelia]CAK92442.1 unnamed protein product [Paramecium tetraurelia]|eukprot:XP_001459839.1 hypothetical protein (macronuclear) [Paramecium tetraurelia strain d4-2]
MKSLRINNQYIMSRKIASGAFGFVMLGFDQKTGQQVAIKIEKPENEHLRSLEKEADIIRRLEGVQGVPKILYFGKQDDFNVLVLQLLSKDLSSLIKKQKKFSLKNLFYRLGLNQLKYWMTFIKREYCTEIQNQKIL